MLSKMEERRRYGWLIERTSQFALDSRSLSFTKTSTLARDVMLYSIAFEPSLAKIKLVPNTQDHSGPAAAAVFAVVTATINDPYLPKQLPTMVPDVASIAPHSCPKTANARRCRCVNNAAPPGRGRVRCCRHGVRFQQQRPSLDLSPTAAPAAVRQQQHRLSQLRRRARRHHRGDAARAAAR